MVLEAVVFLSSKSSTITHQNGVIFRDKNKTFESPYCHHCKGWESLFLQAFTRRTFLFFHHFYCSHPISSAVPMECMYMVIATRHVQRGQLWYWGRESGIKVLLNSQTILGKL